MAPTLKKKYFSEILPSLREQFKHENVMEVPRLDKIVVNMGLGDAPTEARIMETAMAELATITGQKPAMRRARKSISNFKLRQGQPIGCMVTLRGNRMYEFMDRLFNVAIPRIRDFRGIPRNSFDKQGNFTMGLREQAIFPEIKMDDAMRARGMNVTFVIRGGTTKEEAYEMLRQFGLPFRNQN